MKSLAKFPSKAKAAFNPDVYGIELNKPVVFAAKYDGDLGVEIEVEGRNLPTDYGGPAVNGITWVAHNEGSLRGDGKEYVLSQPASLNDTRQLLNNLFEYISDRGGTIINSTRCSTHVHVNVKSLKLDSLCSFVTLYGTFENILTNWCAESRRGNLFALRMCDSSHAVQGWVSMFESGFFDWNHELRYLALNPASLSRFGSLEVRTLEGVDGPDRVIKWSEALLRLREMATTRFKDPTTIANEVSLLGGQGFFQQVFEGTSIYEELIEANGDAIEMAVREGFRRVQPIAYSLPWEAIKPEIEKVWIPNPFGETRKKKASARMATMPVGGLEPR